MAKTKISEYSSTANSNTDVASINIDEGCAPSGINNAIRAVMGHLKDFQQGTNSDSFNGPTNGAHNGTVGATTPAAGTFTTLTASGNVVLGDASTDTLNVGNGGLVKDASGNLGLGVTPSAWNTGYKAVQVNNSGLMVHNTNGNTYLNQSAYFDSGGWKYATSTAAGSYQITDGVHSWNTAASGTAGNAITFTQAMTLDASGRLGIGTTSPSYALDVQGTANTFASIGTTGASSGRALLLRDTKGTPTKYNWLVGAQYNVDNAFEITPSTAVGGSTYSTPAVVVTQSGNLLVGTTSTGPFTGLVTLSKDSGTTKWSVGPYVGNAGGFVVSANTSYGVYLASTTSTSWATASDERVKTDLEPIENAAQKVSTLRAVTGKFIADPTGPRKPFLIAQDVLAVLPEAVDTRNPDKYGLSYTEVIPLLVAAIKELKTENDSLKARLDAANL